ncbi:MAG: hypothetical protein P1S60_03385 [Anaerolineae bacterium]|nr:hypothetical protein [Anaerolineae bacterium]
MFKWFLPTVVAVVCGLITLLGSLLPIPVFSELRSIFVQWASVLTVFAFILAYSSVLKVHISRIAHIHQDSIASLILLLSAIATLIIVILQGPEGLISQFMVQHILVPGESALIAVTAITLLLAGLQLFRTHRDVYGVIFFAVVILVLLGTIPFFYHVFMETLLRVLDSAATAGMRGLLLGIVLGTTLTGLRVIFGMDRPYSQE